MTLKRLCCHLWTENENKITELQLSMLVRMLKTPNFSTRMNALQVSLIEVSLEAYSSYISVMSAYNNAIFYFDNFTTLLRNYRRLSLF